MTTSPDFNDLFARRLLPSGREKRALTKAHFIQKAMARMGQGADAAKMQPSAFHKFIRGGNAADDLAAAQKQFDALHYDRFAREIDDVVGKKDLEIGDLNTQMADQATAHANELAAARKAKGVNPLLAGGAAVGAGALGIGGGAAVSHAVTKQQGEQDAKQRALLGFGGGVAAGLAAPRLMQGAMGAMGGMNGGMQPQRRY